MAANRTSNAYSVCGDDLHSLAVQVGHDVRSPLTAICSYAECLGWAGAVEPLARDRYARAIVVETQRIKRMLSDFMVLAGHRGQSPAEDVDFGAVVQTACADVAEFLALRQVTLDASLPGPYCTVTWPPEVLRHIAAAALDTVLSAAAEGSRVRVWITGARANGVELGLTTLGEALLLHLPRLLSYRATALLLVERGGELRRVQGEEAGLMLVIPTDGRHVCAAAGQEARKVV